MPLPWSAIRLSTAAPLPGPSCWRARVAMTMSLPRGAASAALRTRFSSAISGWSGSTDATMALSASRSFTVTPEPAIRSRMLSQLATVALTSSAWLSWNRRRAKHSIWSVSLAAVVTHKETSAACADASPPTSPST